MRRARAARGQRGQATVELALALPLAVIILAALFEIGLLVTDQVRLVNAAREATRVAVVDPDPDEVHEAARSSGLDSIELTITPRPEERVQGEPLTVKLSYHPQGRVPLIGELFARATLDAAATMRIEQP